MKKLWVIVLIFLFSFNSSLAVEEIKLETEEHKFDYLSDVYYGKVEDANPILKLFSKEGLKFENSPINSVKATFLYEGQLQFLKNDHQGLSVKHDFSVVEPMISTRFNNNKSVAMFDINLVRDLKSRGYTNSFTQKISQVYIAHDFNKNQRILAGQGSRLPSSYNGSRSTMQQEFVLKSQLGRILGDARAVGIRNIAKYKYIDYDIGLYDSTRFMKDFGHGLDFTGQVIFKPLANISEKCGDIKIGTGYSVGEYRNHYNQYSIFLGYDWNKIHFRSEYANADGYNAIVYSRDKADGFYTTLSYDITPKLSILARYDYFDSNKNIGNNSSQEYTAGITYNMYKNMKIMLNLVRRDYDNKTDSNMILFATRFIL